MNMENIVRIICDEIAIRTGNKNIHIDDNLLDNGFDSKSIIDLIRSIEEKLGIEFGNSRISYNSIKSVKSLSESAMQLLTRKTIGLNITESMNDVPWWSTIPISVNSAFGDALTPMQIDDTCMKLESLKNHNAAYGFCTKSVPDDVIYNKLKRVPITPNLSVRYSLTGLDEGGFTFDERIDAIRKLKEIFGRVIIITRPLIFGRNTSCENLTRLVKVARDTSGLLITGGIHDETKRKHVDDDVKKQLLSLCDKYGVKYFHKSSCASAYITGRKCWVHNLNEPKNMFVLDKLGYQYSIEDNHIILKQGTVGDLNFLRMITGSDVYCRKLISGYNILSFSDENCKFEVTSSWYSWSQNRPCQINCDYCIIRDIEYLKNNCVIGVNPSEIENYAVNSKRNYQDIEWKKGKCRITDSKKYIGYDNIRSIQDCMTNAYN